MSKSYNLPLRAAAVLASASVIALSWAPAASAAEGDVEVTNTETVQVYTDATGAVQTKRIYEQLAFTGDGTVDVVNPIEPDGLRNLDGFGGFDVEDGNQVTSVTVDGEERLRTVSDFEGDLPLEVDVTYTLDGEQIDPEDVVGESGKLEVLYTVRNVTSTQQEVSFDDGSGGTVTKTVDVPMPIVGSVTTTLPSTFTEVASNQANMAGDGKGGTKLSFTLTLFPPIGTDTAEIGYTATIVDGVVPRTDITALPVNPLDVPTFANAAKSYQGGADTGIQLAEGAATIDENLLKLRDGAAELLAGLIKLRDGSNQLYVGLAGTAVPGARKLADGMGQLDGGLGQLADGSGQLADGTEKASDGSGQLQDGAGRLSGGLNDLGDGALQLDNGARQLLAGQKALRDGLRQLEAGVEGLPQSVKEQLENNPSYTGLIGGLQKVARGLGDPNNLINPDNGLPTLYGGLKQIADGIPTSKQKLQCAAAILGDLVGGAATPAACGTPVTPLPDVVNPDPTTQAIQRGVLSSMATQLSGSVTDLDTMLAGVQAMQAGLYNPSANVFCSAGAATPDKSDDCGATQAIRFFAVAIPLLVDGITASIRDTLLAGISVPSSGCDPDAMTLLCGANALVAGTGDLKDGTAKLLAGSGELDAGGQLLYDKLGELTAGLETIDDGAGKLADGAAKAKDGSVQLADGSDQLADGLGDAADGSRQITDGLGQAAEGAPKLVDGAGRLSDEGTSKLVEAGEDTAQNYGELYATIEAGAELADAEKMAYGGPEGSQELMAYSYVIEGENGETGRNLARGLTGLALLGAGAGAFAFRRMA